MNTVDAPAGKRLGSWLLDSAPPAVLFAVFCSVSGPLWSQRVATPGIPAQLVLPGTLFALATLGYTGFLWWWEATTGKTVGNLLLKLRTTTQDGTAPGWGPVIRRRILIALAGVVPVAGPALVVVSQLFDRDGQRQGWHDKVAGTLVLDIAAGRDPLATGPVADARAFAPAGDPGFVADAAAGPAASGPRTESAGPARDIPSRGTAFPDSPARDSARAGGVITSVPGSSRAPQPAPAPVPAPDSEPGAAPDAAPGAHPDDAFTHTRLRVDRHAATRLVFDDGQVHRLERSLLIGRNPSAAADEEIGELLRLDDGGRSVSKTHLLVQPGSSGIWVTDRNSTNGSRVVDAAGAERELPAGQSAPAAVGDTVYLGERHFTVEPA